MAPFLLLPSQIMVDRYSGDFACKASWSVNDGVVQYNDYHICDSLSLKILCVPRRPERSSALEVQYSHVLESRTITQDCVGVWICKSMVVTLRSK